MPDVGISNTVVRSQLIHFNVMIPLESMTNVILMWCEEVFWNTSRSSCIADGKVNRRSCRRSNERLLHKSSVAQCYTVLKQCCTVLHKSRGGRNFRCERSNGEEECQERGQGCIWIMVFYQLCQVHSHTRHFSAVEVPRKLENIHRQWCFKAVQWCDLRCWFGPISKCLNLSFLMWMASTYQKSPHSICFHLRP